MPCDRPLAPASWRAFFFSRRLRAACWNALSRSRSRARHSCTRILAHSTRSRHLPISKSAASLPDCLRRDAIHGARRSARSAAGRLTRSATTPILPGRPKISGVPLEELTRLLGAAPESDLVVAICDDQVSRELSARLCCRAPSGAGAQRSMGNRRPVGRKIPKGTAKTWVRT